MPVDRLLKEVVGLWYELRNVPTYEDEKGVNRLGIEWKKFAKGTDIEDVWHALESQCPRFSAGEAMQGAYKDILIERSNQ